MRKIYSFLLLTCLLLIGTNAWADLSKASSIAAGDQVAFVCESAKAELTGISSTSTKYGIQTAYQTSPAGTLLFDVVAGASDGTFAFKNGDNYLVWNSGNSLDYSTTLNANSSWTVSFSNGDAIILNASDTGRKLRYNSASPRFACYTSTQTAIQLYKVVAGDVCATPNISGDATFYESTEISIACATDDASIYYTLDGSVPTPSSSPYSAPFSITATTTVKAIAVKDGLGNSEVASQTFTLVPLMTVAQARAAIDAQTGTQGAYAKGVVSSIVTAYDSGFKNITFNFVDQAGDEAFLQAYRCLGAEAANVAVGDTVIVTGDLTKYNTTYEFGQGCQIVSLKHPVAPAVPSIDVEETSINVPYTGALDGVINVTYNNITEIVADIEFFEEDGTTPLAQEPNWIITDIDIQTHNLVYVVDVNEGAARTAYMKVWAYDDELNAVYSEIITISQEAYVAPFVITDGVFDFDQNEDYGSGLAKSAVKLQTSTWTAINVTMVMAGRNCWNNYSGAVSQIRLYKASGDSPAGNITFSVPEGNIITNIEFTGASFDMMGAEEGTYVVSGDKKSASWHGFANSVLFTATDRTDIYTIEVTYSASASITLGTNGYSTFAANFSYIVSGATAYKAKYVNDAIVLTQVAGVVAGEGIILKGTEGATATITPSYEVAEDDFIDNELVGVLSPIEAEANYYVLATIDNDNITKFHPCYAGITIPANKAFIEIGEATAPSAIRIEFAENNATNIMNVDDVENAVKFMENGKLFIKKNGVIYNAVGAIVK